MSDSNKSSFIFSWPFIIMCIIGYNLFFDDDDETKTMESVDQETPAVVETIKEDKPNSIDSAVKRIKKEIATSESLKSVKEELSKAKDEIINEFKEISESQKEANTNVANESDKKSNEDEEAPTEVMRAETQVIENETIDVDKEPEDVMKPL